VSSIDRNTTKDGVIMKKQIGLVFGMTAILMSSIPSLALPLAKTNSADALSKTMLSLEQYEQIMSSIVQNAVAMAEAKAEKDKLKIDLGKEAKRIEDSLRRQFTYAYFIEMNSKTMQKNFKDDELKKIVAFYETDLGKKWIKYTPEIITETMANVQTDLQAEMPKLVEAMSSNKKGK
jgi:hypothetical protein